MSGGLSQSEYLFRRVQEWARHDAAEIEMKRPGECWTAVAQGSVLRGMGLGVGQPAPVGECPRHYGIAGSEVWSPSRHAGRDAPFTDSVHGKRMVGDQIAWLVRKGDVILPGRPVEITQTVSCAFQGDHMGCGSTASVTFCATTMDEAPSSLRQLPAASNEVSVLEVMLDEIPVSCRRSGRRADGVPFVKAWMQVTIRAGYTDGRGVEVRVLCGGRLMADYKTNL